MKITTDTSRKGPVRERLNIHKDNAAKFVGQLRQFADELAAHPESFDITAVLAEMDRLSNSIRAAAYLEK
jgi:hypothetical protein